MQTYIKVNEFKGVLLYKRTLCEYLNQLLSADYNRLFFSFVEGMAPVFSRSAWYCTWHLIQVCYAIFLLQERLLYINNFVLFTKLHAAYLARTKRQKDRSTYSLV